MKRQLLVSAGIFLALCVSAQAETGKAGARPGEWYVGVGMGAAAHWGPRRQAYIEGEFDGIDHIRTKDVDFDEGHLVSAGLELGYVLQEPMLFDRVEFNFDASFVSRDEGTDGADAGILPIQKGALLILGFYSALGSVDIDADDEETDLEARLSFKSTLADDGDRAIIASIEPFYRHQDTDGREGLSIGAGKPTDRLSDIDADYVGLQLAAEVEQAVSESLSLVGRASAGLYHVDADIDVSLPVINDGVEDSDGTWGGRFGGALGVKIPFLYAGASLTLLGTVDYFTDVPTIDQATFDPNASVFTSPTSADFDDRLDVGGKVTVVFPLR